MKSNQNTLTAEATTYLLRNTTARTQMARKLNEARKILARPGGLNKRLASQRLQAAEDFLARYAASIQHGHLHVPLHRSSVVNAELVRTRNWVALVEGRDTAGQIDMNADMLDMLNVMRSQEAILTELSELARY